MPDRLEVNGQPLGPGGIADRIRQLQEALGEKPAALPLGGQDSFASQLSGLTGQLNGPISPFGAGTDVSPAQAPAELKGLITATAQQHGIDPDLLNALVKQESGYSTTARSKVGAMGLTQLMPGTARGLGVTDPFDPVQNLAGGAKYLKQMLNEFGNIPEALAAYNAGPGAVRKYGGVPPYKETQGYVKNIVAHFEAAKSKANG